MPFPSPSRYRRWYLIGAIVFLAAGAALLAFRRWGPQRPASDRVAVAVFVNRTGDPALEPLGSMAADWITHGLTQSELVDVVDVGAIHAQGRTSGDPRFEAINRGQ